MTQLTLTDAPALTELHRRRLLLLLGLAAIGLAAVAIAEIVEERPADKHPDCRSGGSFGSDFAADFDVNHCEPGS